jgi:hypothetical protein
LKSIPSLSRFSSDAGRAEPRQRGYEAQARPSPQAGFVELFRCWVNAACESDDAIALNEANELAL